MINEEMEYEAAMLIYNALPFYKKIVDKKPIKPEGDNV